MPKLLKYTIIIRKIHVVHQSHVTLAQMQRETIYFLMILIFFSHKTKRQKCKAKIEMKTWLASLTLKGAD